MMNDRRKGARIPVRRLLGDGTRGPEDARRTWEAGQPTDLGEDKTRMGDVDVVKQRRRERPPEIPNVGASGDEDVDWRDAAMRLKAEMDNYRKRQRRWAETSVEREKADLLRRFLEVIDNLEQALKHLDPQDAAHQGVQLAYDGILTLLIREGVERIFAQGRPFDPEVHEAVAVVSAPPDQQEDMRVVEEMSSGYRFNDRVLRPAKVVVAKRGS